MLENIIERNCVELLASDNGLWKRSDNDDLAG